MSSEHAFQVKVSALEVFEEKKKKANNGDTQIVGEN